MASSLTKRFGGIGQVHEDQAPDDRVELARDPFERLHVASLDLDVRDAGLLQALLRRRDGLRVALDPEHRSLRPDQSRGQLRDVTAARTKVQYAHPGRLVGSEGS